jgi:hypothetical protein
MRMALSVILQLSLLAAAQTASSQSPFAHLPDGPAMGISVDRFHYEDEGAFTTMSFHLSRLRHNSLGLELGVAIFPEYLSFPALVAAPDAGAAFNISLPGGTLLLRGGAGALVAFGRGLNTIFYPGAHLGAGAIIRIDRRTALRADALKRWYMTEGETVPFWSIGLGFSILHQ